MAKGKKTQTTEKKPPWWVENAAKQAVNLGSKIGSQQYEAYSGDRVAGLSENERKGVDLAHDRVGGFDPYADKAGALLDRGTQSFTDADMKGYMNPYIESALDPAARKISEAGGREADRLKGMQSSIGAFGGSRGALLESQNLENTQTAIGDLYKTGMSDAFDRATQLWGADRAREMQAAGQFMELGKAVQDASNQDIHALMVTGATDRTIQQAMKDFDYQQFVEGRDWDIRNLGGLVAALQGTQGSYTETVTQTQKGGGNVLGQVLGIAGAVIGGIYGGPAGAAAGASIGGAIGGGGGESGFSEDGGFSSFDSANDWLEGGSLTAPAT